jgi:hypothetical protein
VSFEYCTDVPTEDGEGTEEVVFHLKDAGDVPVGILRRNRRNQDGLMWDTFEWAMPADEIEAFDRMSVSQVVEMFQAWQESQPTDQDKPTAPPKRKRASKSDDED